ncbi:MAG: histidinol dehydrogenase, partial [Verrucomicrobia bacterium]|nr:histidinol dehydrogenase [Verrucomicrobiota bacterium]
MNVLKFSDKDFAARLTQLAAASSLFDPVVEERARGIVAAVRERGDAALLELTARFDGAQLAAEQLAVSQAEIFGASLAADDSLRAAVTEAEKNIAAFARKSLRKNWSARNSHGATVGEKFDGFQRVGIYIPGGTAPLVSTALMTITLARVAGCREIVVCTPPGKDGSVNPALLFAARTAGATEIYKAGGAQAIAALALGTATIRPVQKVFGPGNAYVVAAKRLLVGHVAIDLLPGPSEVLVLADDSANPKFIAADLLAQAEHGSGHERVWLVTTSAKMLKATEKEIARQLPQLARREFIAKALANNGWLILVKSLADGIALVNRLAPEHCEVMVRQPQRAVAQITTAGAL